MPEIEPVFLGVVVDAGTGVGRRREIWRRLKQTIFLEQVLDCLSFFADAASRPRRMLRGSSAAGISAGALTVDAEADYVGFAFAVFEVDEPGGVVGAVDDEVLEVP